MIVLRLLGRNFPEPWPARRSAKQSGGVADCQGASVQARAALDAANAVIR